MEFNLKAYLTEKGTIINSELNHLVQNHPNAGCLLQAMHYSLMAGGKRIRPILCMAAAEAVEGNGLTVLPTACALEMIHTYSLIHDDLPEMDNDDLRRGKPTCHVAYGEPTALLAGDALLTMAFEVLSTSGSTHDASAGTILRVIRLIATQAGCRGMIEGQIQDMAAEETDITIEQLEHLHRLKTGALIKASVLSGAMLAGGTNDQLEQLENYAESIGLAFQVTDDILNVEGDSKLLGKAVGTDDQRKKSTYPSLMGLNESKIFAKRLVNNALKALQNFDNKSDPLRAVARYIIERKK